MQLFKLFCGPRVYQVATKAEPHLIVWRVDSTARRIVARLPKKFLVSSGNSIATKGLLPVSLRTFIV